MPMNMNNEIRKLFLIFLNKVLDQSYTRNEWENFSFYIYQNPELENIRKEAVAIISKNLEPNGFQMKVMDQETRNSLQAVIDKINSIDF